MIQRNTDSNVEPIEGVQEFEQFQNHSASLPQNTFLTCVYEETSPKITWSHHSKL